MSEKFTPGPWYILGEDVGADHAPYLEIAYGECGTEAFKEVAHAFSTLREGDFILTDEDTANAHLISAAPDMFLITDAFIKAMRLSGVDPVKDSNDPMESLLWNALQARAKARGEGSDNLQQGRAAQ